MGLIRDREKILRKPMWSNYPIEVCNLCGTIAAQDSKTQLEKYMEFGIAHCGICKDLTQCASPRDFGWPTFYTYANGSPVNSGDK